MARDKSGAETINYEDQSDVVEALKQMTGGRGPDACIDAVGLEAHDGGLAGAYDKAKQKMRLETDRPHALREAIQACAKGGTVSIPGVYGAVVDKFPIGVAFSKGLTFKMGQTHVHRYMKPLLDRIEKGDIDPSFVITHRAKLDEAPGCYKIFRDKQDDCIKVVLKPH
jgi:threonine dehydrogenase-like Zn-dependent dehydrogenase